MLRANSKVKVYLFFMGEGMLVPSLVAKMTGKPLVIALAGSLKKIHESDRSFLSRLYIFLEDINYKLANKLVVYSPKLVREWDLEKYRNKILIGHEHYLDFDEFRITEKFVSRGQVAGYVGRLSEEKGINNLVQSISLVIREANDIHFAIGGDGPLKAKLSEYVTRHSLDQTVQFYGWIDHKELPKFLNTVKLVIIPSYTEGLPNAMLEAMACGALVLSTPVGAIPDFIRDGETGFLMEDNSPECIARNVVRVMKRKDLELISRNAQALVAQQFNFSSAVEQYQKVITSAITIHST